MWPDATNTQELLDQAKRGDSRAAQDLLTRHREAVRRAKIKSALGPAGPAT